MPAGHWRWYYNASAFGNRLKHARRAFWLNPLTQKDARGIHWVTADANAVPRLALSRVKPLWRFLSGGR